MKRLKSFLTTVVKLTVAVAILFIVMRQVDFDVLRKSACSVWLIPAMFFYLLHMLSCGWRWQVLAKAGGVHISLAEAFSLTMQGFFFSLVIPGGAIGGDVVKMGLIARQSDPGRRTDGVFSVLVDRVAGMVGLFLLALILVVCRWELLGRVSVPGVNSFSGSKHFIPLVVVLVSAGGIIAGGVMFCWRSFEKVRLFYTVFRWIDRHSGNLISRLENAVDAYRDHWLEFLLLVLFSVVFVHLGTVFCFGFLLTSFGMEFDFITVATAVTVGNIAGIIPLFPGGIGARDVTVLAVLGAAGMPDCAEAQFMFTVLAVFFSLTGGLFFIFDPGRKNIHIGS